MLDHADKTITREKMLEFERLYFKNKFPLQRYGQAFCNHFNITCAELFYEEDTRTAKMKVWANFVD